jgi:hypothetical protein
MVWMDAFFGLILYQQGEKIVQRDQGWALKE